MQAVVLAAGNSKRFYPYNSKSNKAFVKIFGKTIFEHTLLSIKKSGIKEIIVVVSDADFAKKSLTQDVEGLNIIFVEQKEALGMGDALLKSKDLIKNDFFVLNATHLDFHEFYPEMVEKKKGEVLLLTKREENVGKFGVLKVEGDRVLDLIEKPQEGVSNLRVIGIYFMSKNFLDILEKTKLEQYSFEKAIASICPQGLVHFVETKKHTVSLKFAWDLLNFKNYFLENMDSYKSSSAQISQHAVIEGKNYFSDGVKVMEGAVIKGNNYIGRNSVIGSNAIIRGNTVIEDNCTVGASSEVKNTIMFDNSSIHSGFLGDSIIGEENKLAANFVTANKRIDRQEVKVELDNTKIDSGFDALGVITGSNVAAGIRVSTMPGVIIGNNVTIGPSTNVMKNIYDNSKFFATFKENIEKKSS